MCILWAKVILTWHGYGDMNKPAGKELKPIEKRFTILNDFLIRIGLQHPNLPYWLGLKKMIRNYSNKLKLGNKMAILS